MKQLCWRFAPQLKDFPCRSSFKLHNWQLINSWPAVTSENSVAATCAHNEVANGRVDLRTSLRWQEDGCCQLVARCKAVAPYRGVVYVYGGWECPASRVCSPWARKVPTCGESPPPPPLTTYHTLTHTRPILSCRTPQGVREQSARLKCTIRDRGHIL